MAENNGRDLTVAIGTDGSEVTLTGVRTKSFTINNEPVDITNDDDNAWRDYLAEPGQKSIGLSIDGVSVDDDALALASSASDVSTNCLITFPLGGGTTPASYEGTAFITSYQETGEYNGAVTYSLALESMGSWTYTAES